MYAHCVVRAKLLGERFLINGGTFFTALALRVLQFSKLHRLRKIIALAVLSLIGCDQITRAITFKTCHTIWLVQAKHWKILNAIRAIFIAGVKPATGLHKILEPQRFDTFHPLMPRRKINHRDGIIFLQRGVGLGVVACNRHVFRLNFLRKPCIWRDHVHASLGQIRLLFFKRVKAAIAKNRLVSAARNIHNSNRTNRIDVTVDGRLAFIDNKHSLAIVREFNHVGIETNFHFGNFISVEIKKSHRATRILASGLACNRDRIAAHGNAVESVLPNGFKLLGLGWIGNADAFQSFRVVGEPQSFIHRVIRGNFRARHVPPISFKSTDVPQTQHAVGHGCR